MVHGLLLTYELYRIVVDGSLRSTTPRTMPATPATGLQPSGATWR